MPWFGRQKSGPDSARTLGSSVLMRILVKGWENRRRDSLQVKPENDSRPDLNLGPAAQDIASLALREQRYRVVVSFAFAFAFFLLSRSARNSSHSLNCC